MKRIVNYTHALIIYACIQFVISCSGADPIIYDIKWELQSFQEYPSKEIYERLLLHILADDDDGFDEIYELYVINDDSERYWRITQDEWKILTIDSFDWISINSIVSEQYEKLPRGEYRVLILDFSGFRDERKFHINYEYLKEDWFYYIDNVHTYINDTIPFDIFPEFKRLSNNTYVPLLQKRLLHRKEESKDGQDIPIPFYMQLIHPLAKKDLAGNVLIQNNLDLISSLGDNGAIYKIEPNKRISFIPSLDENNSSNGKFVEFLVYFHYRLEDVTTVSAGPFTIKLDGDTNIYQESIEDIVTIYE